MEISYIAHKNDYKIRATSEELRTLVQSVEDSQRWLDTHVGADKQVPEPFQNALKRWRAAREQLLIAMKPHAEGLGGVTQKEEEV